MPRLSNTCRGMTLIEVLVAFVVLSLAMAVIMQIFSGGMRNGRLARLYQVRVRVGWSEEGRERQIELSSLRLGPRS